MSAAVDRNFILQQGFASPDPASCERVTSSLQFQPRLVGVGVVAGVIMQSPAVFAVLAAVLWWGALVPRLNLFDLIYNVTLGQRAGASRLGPAPVPRRFAQGMAGTFAAAIAASLAAELWILAWVLEALFVVAVVALVFGRFCLGSFVYHLLHGRAGFAMKTLPWGRGV